MSPTERLALEVLPWPRQVPDLPSMKTGLKRDSGWMTEQHRPLPFGEKYLSKQVMSMKAILLENLFQSLRYLGVEAFEVFWSILQDTAHT